MFDRTWCLAALFTALACSPNAATADDGAPSGAIPVAGQTVGQTATPVVGQTSAPAGAQVQVAAANDGRLTEDMAVPYFDSGVAGKAAESLALRDYQAARSGFARYLKSREGRALDRAGKARVRLLIARADDKLRDWGKAAQGYGRASRELPLLADYCHYHAARAYYFARDMKKAMEHARAVSATSIVGADAELLVGDLLRGGKKFAEMAAHYEKYLADRPKGIRQPEARYRLAQAYENSGRPADDSIALYREVTIRWPLSAWSERAQKRLDALLPGVSKKARKRYQTLSADELVTRGMAYYKAMRNPLSEADFKAAKKAPGNNKDNRCVAAYHQAQSVFKARDRKRAAPLFDKAIKACAKAKNIDLQVKGAYQAGRSYAMTKKRETAIKRYRKAETISKAHTYVDDALLRQAEEFADLGQDDKVKEALAAIPERYPTGDMRAEAVWRLAWRAYREGDYAEAVRWLEKQIEIMPIDDHYYAEGQAQYWLGRSYGQLGDTDKSIAAYRDAVTVYPLSYYALLALNRLRDDHPEAFSELKKAIETPPAGYDAKAPAFTFKKRQEYSSDGFKRAIEFLRLGLGSPAEAELRRLGLNIPPGKKRLHDADHIEKVWATAFLYDRAKRYSQSHWPTRWHILDYKRQWPTGHNYARWRIAYPRGYWSLIEEHAGKHGYPTELMMGIVREESAFDPLRESYANAIGLSQMIFPTARRFGKGTGIDITRENLRNPEKNVTIGSRFLGFLWKKWDGHIMLIPPSYNAGEGAVSRWLRERGTLPADEWLESIKGDQARRYSKRVIASYFIYAYLERGDIPYLSNTIPKRLIPKKKKKKATKKKAAKKKTAKKKTAKKKTAKKK